VALESSRILVPRMLDRDEDLQSLGFESIGDERAQTFRPNSVTEATRPSLGRDDEPLVDAATCCTQPSPTLYSHANFVMLYGTGIAPPHCPRRGLYTAFRAVATGKSRAESSVRRLWTGKAAWCPDHHQLPHIPTVHLPREQADACNSEAGRHWSSVRAVCTGGISRECTPLLETLKPTPRRTTMRICSVV